MAWTWAKGKRGKMKGVWALEALKIKLNGFGLNLISKTYTVSTYTHFQVGMGVGPVWAGLI